MSRLDWDTRQTLRSVADHARLRPEERRDILDTLLAELERGGSLGQAPEPAWRWLSVVVISVLMLVSLASHWQPPTVAAHVRITPYTQATPIAGSGVPQPAISPSLQTSITPRRPGAMTAPHALYPMEQPQTLEPAPTRILN